MIARKILVHCLFMTACGFAALACQGPEPFYREESGLGGSPISGTAGSNISGVGGATGAAGSSGVAGSSSGVAGTTGAAGEAGSPGAAGSQGVAGSSGVAGSGPAGASGVAGSAAAGSTGAAGMARGGSTGTAGATAGKGGSTGAAGAAPGKGGSTGAAGRAGSTGTAGAAAGSTGTAGSAAPPPPIQIAAKCQSAPSTNTITISFRVLNLGNTAVPFSTITARYFYTLEDPAMTVPQVEFDYVQSFTKAQIIVTATATYVEFGFAAGTNNLQAFDNISGSGEISARIHPPNYSPSAWDTNQVNDPSYKACTGTTFDPRPGFIGYVGGKQSWPAPTTP
jgi:hypothetical protein